MRNLRLAQFPEDAGPLAHPVRPALYQEINNFYTATVYEKGAEIVRMLKTLIGEADFKRGMDLYFERFDGTPRQWKISCRVFRKALDAICRNFHFGTDRPARRMCMSMASTTQ